MVWRVQWCATALNMEVRWGAMEGSMVCKANPQVRSFDLDTLTEMALKQRCPPAICRGAPTTHDLTWLIVGASDDLSQPWDPNSDVAVEIPVRRQASLLILPIGTHDNTTFRDSSECRSML